MALRRRGGVATLVRTFVLASTPISSSSSNRFPVFDVRRSSKEASKASSACIVMIARPNDLKNILFWNKRMEGGVGPCILLIVG